MIQQHGILIVNKPCGLSSAQCTNRFKRLGQKKIGHAGTLDPMASGVLVVLLGHATKIASYLLSGGKKIYQGKLRLGQDTDTWDTEGKIVAEYGWENITESAVHAEIKAWIGKSMQIVPPYSAAKYAGQPLYRLARAGKTVPTKEKNIEIADAEVLQMHLPDVTFRVTCSSGTYIRSLAHSLGTRLGCGAVLTELVREYSYPFGLQDALPLKVLLAEPKQLAERILPLPAALPDWICVRLDTEATEAVRNGRSVRRDSADAEHAILLAADRTPLALACAENCTCMPVWKILRGLWSD